MEWLIAIVAWAIILLGAAVVLIGLIGLIVGITGLFMDAAEMGIPVAAGAAVVAIVGVIVIVAGVLILPGRNYPDDDAISAYRVAAANYVKERRRLDGLTAKAQSLAAQSGRARLAAYCYANAYTGAPFPEQEQASLNAQGLIGAGADCAQIVDAGEPPPPDLTRLALAAAVHGPANARFHTDDDNTVTALLRVPNRRASIPAGEIEKTHKDIVKEETAHLRQQTIRAIELTETASGVTDRLIAGVRDSEAANRKYIASLAAGDAESRRISLAYALRLANRTGLSTLADAPLP